MYRRKLLKLQVQEILSVVACCMGFVNMVLVICIVRSLKNADFCKRSSIFNYNEKRCIKSNAVKGGSRKYAGDEVQER